MQRFILFFNLILLCSLCYSDEEISAVQEALNCPFVYESVNVINGEYAEVQTDLTLESLVPIKIRRCFVDAGQTIGEKGWKCNLPNLFSTETWGPDEERLSNRSLHYEYDAQHRIRSLKITDPQKQEVFGWLKFQYELSEKLHCYAEASDGQKLYYRFAKADKEQLLEEVAVSTKPRVNYQYCEHPGRRGKLVACRENPEGRYVINEYYQSGVNQVGNVSVDIGFSAREFCLGRVKLQKKPLGYDQTPIIAQRFFYYPNFTEVYDALDHKTVYYYTDDQHLTAIEKYDSSEGIEKLYRAERLYWKKIKNGERRLISRTWEDGHRQIQMCRTFAYDDKGRLISEKLYGNLTGTNEAPLVLGKDHLPLENGIESYGTAFIYAQDSDRLLCEKEQSGSATLYIYDSESPLLSAKLQCDNDQIVSRTFYDYDASGRIFQMTADNGTSHLRQDLIGATERHFTRYLFKDNVSLYPDCIEESYFDFSSKQEKLLKRTEFQYCQGKVSRETVYDGEGQLCEISEKEYDEKRRVVSSRDAQGNITFFTYDENDNCLSVRTINSKGSEIEFLYIYDYANRVIQKIEQDETKSRFTGYRYDYLGNQIATVDEYGNETLHFYDTFGREIKTLFPCILDSSNQSIQPVIKCEYDIFDRKTLVIDANGYATRTRYNVRGKPIQIGYPDGTKESFEYTLEGFLAKHVEKTGIYQIYHRDTQGRAFCTETFGPGGELLASSLTEFDASHPVAITDPKGNVSTFAYDGAGRCTRVSQLCGNSEKRMEYAYNMQAQITEVKEWFSKHPSDYAHIQIERDRNNQIHSYSIKDSKGKILKKVVGEQAEVGKERMDEEQWLNDRGQYVLRTTMVHPGGSTTRATFDACGRIESVVVRDGYGRLLTKTELRWDAAGNKIKETEWLIHNGIPTKAFATIRKFGPGNRLESIVEAAESDLMRKTIYCYNEKGQIACKVKPDGCCIYREYNVWGDLSRLWSSDGTIDDRYIYDESRKLVQAEDLISHIFTERFYTSSNLVQQEALGNGLSVSNRYDLMGRRTILKLPDGSSIRYEYDAAYLRKIERFSSEGVSQYVCKNLNYDEAGRPISVNMIRGLGTLSYCYDFLGRLNRIQAPFWREDISYNTSSSIEKVAFEDPAGAFTNEYHYDFFRHLAEENGQVHHHFQYDSIGNRLFQNQTPYHYNDLCQLMHTDEADYTYDANGCLIELHKEGKLILFKYDALNRLISITQEQTSKVEYRYDAFNRRLSKKIHLWDSTCCSWELQQECRFLYDGDEEIGSVDAQGTIQELRILGLVMPSGPQAIALEIDGKVYAPIQDHRGSLCCLIDATTGSVAAYSRYSAFGEEQLGLNTTLSPWRFCGKRIDPETHLAYFGNRYYSPELGRWITPDPLGSFDGANLYSYVHNNPVEMIDPTGLFSLSSIWQNVSNTLLSICNGTINIFKTVNSYIHSHLSFYSHVQVHVENFGQEILGRALLLTLGFYNDQAEIGVYGNGELNDRIRITLINGILNAQKDCVDTAALISKTHGGVNVHYIFRPTEGWTRDILKCAAVKFGFFSPGSKELAKAWKDLIEEMGGVEGGGIIIHYAHSIGGTDTSRARFLLTPEEQKMIRVITFGSATLMDGEGYQSVVNYVSYYDGVSMVDPVGYFGALFHGNENIVFLKSLLKIPLIDHMLLTDTYAAMLEVLGREFVATYAQ